MTTTLGVCRESLPGERRVALTAAAVDRVRRLGPDVVVETAAGTGAGDADADFLAAGARVVGHDELLTVSDVLVALGPPLFEGHGGPRRDQVVLAMLRPLANAHLMRRWASRGATAMSLDLVPADLPGARLMDPAASQAALSGHLAVLLGLRYLDRLPSLALTTGLDPARPDLDENHENPLPVRALVIGSGPDAEHAAATLDRLGITTRTWGVALSSLSSRVRPLNLPSGRAAPTLAESLPGFDLVVCALHKPDDPDGPALLLAPHGSVAAMRRGSVVVDLAADVLGGNVAESDPRGVPRQVGGATVIGAPDLAAGSPCAASAAFADALEALLTHLLVAGKLRLDPGEPLQAAITVTRGGEVVHPGTWQRILDDLRLAGLP